MRRRGLVSPALVWGAACAGLLGVAAVAPHIPAAPARVESQAQPAPGRPGWLAVYRVKGPKPAEVIALSPTAAFALRSGESPHPSIPAAGFTAVYSAQMKIEAPGRYRFGAEVEGGTLSISLVGANLGAPGGFRIDGSSRGPGAAVGPVLSDWFLLKPGDLALRMEFTRSGDAPARLRPMWQLQGKGAEGFGPEPISPAAVSVPAASAQSAAAAATAFQGRVLLGELGCAHCHAAPEGAALLERPAPLLAGIGDRASLAWLRAWVRDPQKVKPGTPMPGVFGDSPHDVADAESIAQYLAAGGTFAPEPIATEAAAIEKGRRIFNTVGCIACHGEFGSDASASSVPAPYGNLAGKWRPSALSAFLRDPLAVRPGGRMPSLNLSEEESDAVATFLLTTWGAAPVQVQSPLDPARVEAGRRAFVARGCGNCHAAPDAPAGQGPAGGLKAKALADLAPAKGCLSPTDAKTPRYTLSAAERDALAAAMAQVKAGATNPSPPDRAMLAGIALNCLKCHERNGQGGVAPALAGHLTTLVEADLGEEGRIPPHLTGVGGKLTTTWLRQVLTESGRARPYMSARMPQFGAAQVGMLAEHLASADGVWPDTDVPEPEATPELTQAGRRLVGSGGLNCISCHAFGDAPLAGTPGPDITAFGERLRYDWWSRYIQAPERFKPGTRMPNFYLTGEGSITDVFAGDPAKQAEAMWAYFSLGEFAPAPEGVPSAGGLEVRVGDRPVILRTFLKSAGSRGIAVGFPAGLHFAFDAEACRLTEVWRGKFLDASGAWAGRGGTIVGGQGPDVWTPPPGPAIVLGERPESWPVGTGRDAGYQFKGYAVDQAGVPEFLYVVESGGAAVAVAERFEPAPGGHIRRTFTLRGLPESGAWINGGAGKISAQGAEAVAVSGQTWLRVAPDGDFVKTVVVEIAP